MVRFIQTAENENTATATSIAVTLTVSAGSTLVVFGNHDSFTGGPGTIACADTLNGSYGAALQDVNDATNFGRTAMFAIKNSLAGSNTVTITLGATHPFRGIYVMEFGGVLPGAFATTDSAANQQATPGVGTNACTSGLMPPLRSGFMLVGFCVDSGGAGTPIISAGFTGTPAAFAFGAGSANIAIGEWERVANSPSAIAATFTAAGNDAHQTFGLLLYEAHAEAMLNAF